MPMTVRELRELLATLPEDMLVVYPNEYLRNEGWRDEDETATCVIYGAFVNDSGDLELEG